MRYFLAILSITLLSATCKKTTFTLNGSKSYAPKGFKSIQWKQVSGQQTSIDNSSVLVTKAEAGYVGVYVFSLTCSFNPDTVNGKIINFPTMRDQTTVTIK